jgi:hypothetical protein
MERDRVSGDGIVHDEATLADIGVRRKGRIGHLTDGRSGDSVITGGSIMTDIFDGGCACGALRYRMLSRPMFMHCCHCKDCQRQTGTAFVLNALIEADRVEQLSGDPKPFGMPTDSGRPHTVFRCPDCGTAVWSNYGGLSKLRFVRIGSLDDPTVLPPDVHIYTRSKLPWITLPQGVPAFDAYYSSRELWPAESLERRKAVMG